MDSFDIIDLTCQCNAPYTPLSYSRIGVYRDIHYFLIFPLKHRSWALVRTALVPTIYAFSKEKDKYHNYFSSENDHFYSREKSQCIKMRSHANKKNFN